MEKNIQLHKELIDYLHNLYITKNNDYGNSLAIIELRGERE